MNAEEKEVAKIIHGDTNVLEAISRFISAANSRIDACVDQTRPALGTNIEQIKADALEEAKRQLAEEMQNNTKATREKVVKDTSKVVKQKESKFSDRQIEMAKLLGTSLSDNMN